MIIEQFAFPIIEKQTSITMSLPRFSSDVFAILKKHASHILLSPSGTHFVFTPFADLPETFSADPLNGRPFRQAVRRLMKSYLAGDCKAPTLVLFEIADIILRRPPVVHGPDNEKYVNAYYLAIATMISIIIATNYAIQKRDLPLIRQMASAIDRQKKHYMREMCDPFLNLQVTSPIEGHSEIAKVIMNLGGHP